MRDLAVLASTLSLVISLGGCAGGDKAGGAWTPGKGDGNFDVVERGPAPLGGSVVLELDHRVPALRVESFGDTSLRIDLKGTTGTDPYVVVEGPLARGGDGIAAGAGDVVDDDDDGGYGRNSKLEVVLREPGVYRILAGTYQSMALGEAPEGTVELVVACRAGCARPSIDQKMFVRALQAGSGGALGELARGRLAELLHDPALAETVGAQLDAILADPELSGLDRFPLIPLSQVAAIRPALGALEADPPRPDEVVTGELVQILGACEPTRNDPSPVDARLPGVGYGHFANRALSPCQAAHSPGLARVLTSLAAGNGSAVTFEGQRISTPRELFAALVASGHTIETRNERTYANFVSLALGDRDVVWPVWLDTGIALSSGQTLVIPVGHSHHAWRITGPRIDTRVMFYLGTSGAGFFAQTQTRPAWTGNITSASTIVTRAAGADYDYLLATVDASAAYLRRNRTERATVAAGLPADGYGFVGVCNDSNAAVEYVTRSTISTFPLLRAAELDAAPALGDGLDAAVRALPKDGDGLADPRDALRRALAMQPFAADAPELFDPGLAAQLAVAARDLSR